MCIVLLLVSCAGDLSVTDDTPTQTVPDVSDDNTETVSPDDTREVPAKAEDTLEESPSVPAVTLSPAEDDSDYYYPEPELIIPEEDPGEPENEVTVTKSLLPAPERAPSIAQPMETAPVKPADSGQKEDVPPAPPATGERTASSLESSEPETSPEPDSPPVIPEEAETESPPESWTDDMRSSEPPPPVFRAEVVPSRSVTVPRDGILEVWYPGTGWVYLGDASGLVGITYDTRKIENRDTLFTFRARRSGNYILEFSRYDVLTDDFMQDALSVTVNDPVPGKRTTVRAPDFVLAGIQNEEGQSGQESVSSASVVDEPVLSAPLSMETEAGVQKIAQDPGELLVDAQDLLASGDPQGALDLLDLFFEKALDELDEGWYLRGQAYEANSSVRNIRKALEAYETVVSAYPDSVRWKDADERIRYIKQFYFRVR